MRIGDLLNAQPAAPLSADQSGGIYDPNRNAAQQLPSLKEELQPKGCDADQNPSEGVPDKGQQLERWTEENDQVPRLSTWCPQENAEQLDPPEANLPCSYNKRCSITFPLQYPRTGDLSASGVPPSFGDPPSRERTYPPPRNLANHSALIARRSWAGDLSGLGGLGDGCTPPNNSAARFQSLEEHHLNKTGSSSGPGVPTPVPSSSASPALGSLCARTRHVNTVAADREYDPIRSQTSTAQQSPSCRPCESERPLLALQGNFAQRPLQSIYPTSTTPSMLPLEALGTTSRSRIPGARLAAPVYVRPSPNLMSPAASDIDVTSPQSTRQHSPVRPPTACYHVPGNAGASGPEHARTNSISPAGNDCPGGSHEGIYLQDCEFRDRSPSGSINQESPPDTPTVGVHVYQYTAHDGHYPSGPGHLGPPPASHSGSAESGGHGGDFGITRDTSHRGPGGNALNVPQDVAFNAEATLRPYACTFCGRTFWRKFDCRRHMRTHTAERPYACQGCDRTFARKDALTRHVQGNASCAFVARQLQGQAVTPPRDSTHAAHPEHPVAMNIQASPDLEAKRDRAPEECDENRGYEIPSVHHLQEKPSEDSDRGLFPANGVSLTQTRSFQQRYPFASS